MDFRSYPVRLTCSPEKGCYFLANSNIKIGEVVLKCFPLATAPFDNHKKRYCYTCNLYNSSSSAFPYHCMSCDQVYFCSLECYNYSNVLVKHELICNTSRRIATWNTDKHTKSVVRLLVKILLEDLWERKRENRQHEINLWQHNDNTLRNHFKDFLLLKSHYLDWSINLKQDWKKHEKFLISLFKSSNLIQDNIDFEEVLHMVSRIESNGFGMYYKSKGREILFGRAIYPCASFFNHSCDANCDATQSNQIDNVPEEKQQDKNSEINSDVRSKEKGIFREIEFVTLRNINEGEELTISYIAVGTYPLQVRRQKLMDDYYFLCKCDRCTAEETKVIGKKVKGLKKHREK